MFHEKVNILIQMYISLLITRPTSGIRAKLVFCKLPAKMHSRKQCRAEQACIQHPKTDMAPKYMSFVDMSNSSRHPGGVSNFSGLAAERQEYSLTVSVVGVKLSLLDPSPVSPPEPSEPLSGRGRPGS